VVEHGKSAPAHVDSLVEVQELVLHLMEAQPFSVLKDKIAKH